MNNDRRLTATVEGKVQGVYFRPFVQEHANSLGICGYALNLPDGRTVEVVAEGPALDLEMLLKKIYQGSENAVVERVHVNWAIAQGKFKRFEVR